MTEKEEKQLENHFESALNDLVSGIKDTTATEVVMREQQMILFYKRVMLEIEKRDNLISKLQADIEIKDKVIDELISLLLEFDIDEIYCSKIKDCIEVTDGKCFDCIKQYFYEQVKKVGGEDE